MDRNDIKNIDLEDIIKKTGLIMNGGDIICITDNSEIRQTFVELNRLGATQKEKEHFLIKNQEHIKKPEFILLMAQNYIDNIKLIEEEIERIRMRGGNVDLELLGIQIKFQREFLKKTLRLGKELKLGKDVQAITCLYKHNQETDEVKIQFIDAREVFQNIKVNKKRNLRRFDEIDKSFIDIDSEHKNGLEYIFGKIDSYDIWLAYPNKITGEAVAVLAHERAAELNGKASMDQLQNMKQNHEFKRYFKMVNSITDDELLIPLKETVREYSYYLDIDKLLLVGAYRYTDELENPNKYNLPPKYYSSVKELLEEIRKNIKHKESEIKGEIKHFSDDGNDLEYIEYNVQDLDETIKRFIDGKYIRREETEEIRTQLLNGSMSVAEVNPEIIELLNLNEEEDKELINQSIENTVFMIEYRKFNERKILDLLNSKEQIDNQLLVYLIQNKKISMYSVLDLYSDSKIKSEFFKKFSEELNISSEELLKEINNEHLELKKQKENSKEYQKTQKKLNAMLGIYKDINIEGKTDDEELEEISSKIMDVIGENIEDEEDILFYYENSLVTLTTVADWTGEEYIEKIFDEGKITKDDLMDLFKKGKISNRLIEENFLEEDKLGEDGAYDRLISLINAGGVSEGKIVDLYLEGKIFDTDFDEMLNNKIISHQRYFVAKDLRTRDKLEENAKIKLSPKLKDIPDKKGLLYSVAEKGEEEPEDWFTGGNIVGSRKKKLLIDPEMRFEFLKKLGAMEAEVLDIEESNAFYNYDFFVIPNSMGEFDLDSVVIAERFYVNKETKDRFATDNATYFFQYKDLMVNSNLSKNEMTKERDKIVFRCAHRVENTLTSWGMNVLHNIAQTMLSTKFERCKTKQELEERTAMVLDQLHKFLTSKQISDLIAYDEEIEEKGIYIVTDQDNVQQSRKKDSIDEGHGEL